MFIRSLVGSGNPRCTGGAIRVPRRAGFPTSRAAFSRAATHRNEIDDEWGRIYGERLEAAAKAERDKNPIIYEPREWEGYSKEDVDSIRRYMTCENFKDSQWGFAIYRCSNKNEKAWNRIVEWLHEDVKESLWRTTGHEDVLQAHDLHIIDDPYFYGGSHHKVRRHFRWWVEESLRSRLKPSLNWHIALKGEYAAQTPRYQYCLFVDDICLESLQHNDPVIKLLDKSWYDPWIPEERAEAVNAPAPWHDGLTNYMWEDVGWMYLGAEHGYFETYLRFSKGDDWINNVYLRPPILDCSDWEGYDKQKWYPHHLEGPPLKTWEPSDWASLTSSWVS